jgi:diacylglycerol kinase family enzyme
VPRILLIVNPFASNVGERELQAAKDVLRPQETILTERRGHAIEIARDAEADVIVALGGDGLANEVLNGLQGDTPVGFLPGGGTSVLARALGLPREVADAARKLDAGRTRRISLGRVNGRRFGFAAGIGIDAATVRRVDELGRRRDGRRPGDLRFAYEFVGLLGGSRAPALEVQGLGRAAAAFVANCDPYTYAGPVPLHVAPAARFELGLDLVAPVRMTPRALPRFARYVVTGRGQTTAPDLLYAHDVDRIEITCERPLPLQADGEDLGDVEHVVLEAERDAVACLV